MESVFYKNHYIVVSVCEHVFGSWHWTYTVDGLGPFAGHGDSSPDRRIALERAIESAKAYVDRSWEFRSAAAAANASPESVNH